MIKIIITMIVIITIITVIIITMIKAVITLAITPIITMITDTNNAQSRYAGRYPAVQQCVGSRSTETGRQLGTMCRK